MLFCQKVIPLFMLLSELSISTSFMQTSTEIQAPISFSDVILYSLASIFISALAPINPEVIIKWYQNKLSPSYNPLI